MNGMNVTDKQPENMMPLPQVSSGKDKKTTWNAEE